MTALPLAFAFLRRRWGQALLSLLVGALGIGAVGTILVVARDIPEAARRAFGGVDLVIGPKGSALDLVMCCVLHVSEPRGLVPLSDAAAAARHPLVRAAAPLALGDNFHGIRIAGSTPDILTVYDARLAQGTVWSKPLDAVVGAAAAHALHLKLGDHFVGSHGLAPGGEEHTDFPYTVAGILAPTGSTLDRLILTGIQTVYTIHHRHEAEEAQEQGLPPPAETPPAATAMLVKFKSPVALASLPRLIDATPNLAAASPALETARLARAGRPLIAGAIGLGLLLTAIAAASAATALMAAMNARAKDLALLRALGAHPAELAAIALGEALLIALGALALGLFLSGLFVHVLAGFLAARDGLMLQGVPALRDILWLGLGALGAACIAAALPALRAAHAPIEAVLNA